MTSDTKAIERPLGLKSAHLPLLQGLSGLRTNSKYADLTLKCGKRSWKIHKAIVCPQSEFFAKACDGRFQEAQKNVITLEDDPEAVAAMVHYFYHFNYQNGAAADEVHFPVLLDIRVFAIAHKYLISPLQDIALGNIRKWLALEWHTDSFSTAISMIYGLEPLHKDMLKSEVVITAVKHRELFTDHRKYKGFQEVLDECHGFAADAARALAKSTPSKTPRPMYKCPWCELVFSIPGKPTRFGCPRKCNGQQAVEWWEKECLVSTRDSSR